MSQPAAYRPSLLRRLTETFLYGNFFLGLCACALAIESLRRLGLHRAPASLLVFVAAATTVFYTDAYRNIGKSPFHQDRYRFYRRNWKFLRGTQILLAAVALACLGKLLATPGFSMRSVWVPGLITLIVAATYRSDFIRGHRLFKPLAVALVWTDLTFVLPVFLQHYHVVNAEFFFRFAERMAFFYTIAVLSDLKDYAEDARNGTGTLVVRLRLRRLLVSFLPVMLSVQTALLLLHTWLFGRSGGWLLSTLLPVAGTAVIGRLLMRRQPLVFYLFWLDGLLLLKALAGIFCCAGR